METQERSVENLTPHNLNQFTGTTQYYNHWTKALVYTDGVQFVGANGGYWIIDLIASHQAPLADVPFQAWKVMPNEKGGFVAICTDGNDKEITRQEGEYTDLKNPIEFFCIADQQFKAVLILTSEY